MVIYDITLKLVLIIFFFIFRGIPPWEEFHNDLTLDSLYSVEAPYMPRLLHSLATAPIKKATVFSPGTQFKILLEFENGNFAIAKPMR